MKRFKHIVAPTDLSPESMSAVAYAGHLARAEGAKLTVLHVPHSTSMVYTDVALPVDMVGIDATIAEAATEELEGWARRHLRNVSKVSLLVRDGVSHQVICEVADEVDASVIVMATHGRKGLGHMLLGSVTERVLRDAPCPVLVVKPPPDAAAKRRPRKIGAKKRPRAAKKRR